jgi:2-(1,2-epoxy-1,2-dihydrophenyl)acetyl-CoA isomerase
MTESIAATVFVEQAPDSAVAVVHLNRPQQLNALTANMLVQLRDAIEAVGQDPSVRAIVLTGEGRGFCAGQDLADPFVAPPQPGQPQRDIGHLIDHYYIPLVQTLRACPVPTVCAVNGVAAGAGVSLALGCDIVLANDAAMFVLGFNKIGLVPDAGATWLLPRLVGRAKALEMALLGDKLSASDAELMGLISCTYPADQLLPQALLVADQLAALPTRALVQTRKLFDDAMQSTLDVALRAESRVQSQLGFSGDYQEGVAAFQQKRAPQFTDK